MGARRSLKARSEPAAPPSPREALSQYALDHDIELIFFDPPEHFDHAIVGLVTGYGQETAVLYDLEKVLQAMAADMGLEAAEEWFAFNTVGAYLGDATPRFLIRPEGGILTYLFPSPTL